MATIHLPQSLERRLEKVARRTGRTKSAHVRAALLSYLEDLGDVQLAKETMKRVRSGEECLIPLEDVMKRYGPHRKAQ